MEEHKVRAAFRAPSGELITSGTWTPPNAATAEKLIKARCLKRPGTEGHKVPTLEEVLASGYSEEEAPGIVAREQAIADGEHPEIAELREDLDYATRSMDVAARSLNLMKDELEAIRHAFEPVRDRYDSEGEAPRPLSDMVADAVADLIDPSAEPPAEGDAAPEPTPEAAAAEPPAEGDAAPEPTPEAAAAEDDTATKTPGKGKGSSKKRRRGR